MLSVQPSSCPTCAQVKPLARSSRAMFARARVWSVTPWSIRSAAWIRLSTSSASRCSRGGFPGVLTRRPERPLTGLRSRTKCEAPGMIVGDFGPRLSAGAGLLNGETGRWNSQACWEVLRSPRSQVTGPRPGGQGPARREGPRALAAGSRCEPAQAGIERGQPTCPPTALRKGPAPGQVARQRNVHCQPAKRSPAVKGGPTGRAERAAQRRP